MSIERTLYTLLETKKTWNFFLSFREFFLYFQSTNILHTTSIAIKGEHVYNFPANCRTILYNKPFLKAS